MRRLVLVDLNGTALNDWPHAYAATRAVFEHYGIPCPTLEMCVRMVAHTGDYHEFYQQHGIDAGRDKIHEIFIPAYRRSGIPPLTEGVVRGIVALRTRGIGVHLLTAAREELALPTLEQCGIVDIFEEIHMHVGNKGAYARELMEQRGYAPEDTYMVGDLPSDALHAAQARARGIALIGAHVPRDLFKGIPLTHAVFDFHGLCDLFA